MTNTVEAALTWIDGAFVKDRRITMAPSGRIENVGPCGPEPDLRLPRTALLPGFVNAHSHAFQRDLRGDGERFPTHGGDFWSWREAMYDLVGTLDAQTFYAVCLRAFSEMLDTGITTVGEFHYLHHRSDAIDFEFDHLVLEAAEDAGIRIVLLNAYYATGGIGAPLDARQQRFAVTDPDRYWHQHDRLGAVLGSMQSLGTVVHSIRASSLDDLVAVHREAMRRNLPFHMHVEEQPREIADCTTAYGARPLEMLLDRLDIGPRFTAVHCTHTPADLLARMLDTGATACICPLTEANLGDGIPDLDLPASTPRTFSLGTDSNARIGMIEEMRWLEYGQRLRTGRRGMLRDDAGRVAPGLIDAATAGGARALGLDAGGIAAGRLADLVAIDLEHPSLAGVAPDQLAEALVFGSGDAAVQNVCVNGRWRRRF